MCRGVHTCIDPLEWTCLAWGDEGFCRRDMAPIQIPYQIYKPTCFAPFPSSPKSTYALLCCGHMAAARAAY